MSDIQSQTLDPTEEAKLGLGAHAAALAVVCVIALVGNTVATENTVPQGLVGLIILWVMCMIGMLLTKFVPFKLPSVAWISAVGILATMPWTPGSAWILDKVSHVNFLTLATPCLAYAGIAIARREIESLTTHAREHAFAVEEIQRGQRRND